MTRETAQNRLARLRAQLTFAFGAMSMIAIGSLAAVTTIVDAQLRAERFDAEVQGLASRAAALVFFDDELGRWNVEGLLDDTVATSTTGILVVDALGGVELLSTADFDEEAVLVLRTLGDDLEEGVVGDVLVNGERTRAAGTPYFGIASESGATGVVGAVVVAAEPSPDPGRNRLLSLVWGTAAALVAMSTAISWIIAGRVVKPMGRQLDREEAFLATAAHELRTPLGRFKAVAESALLSARQLPRTTTRDEVTADVRRIVQLTDDTTKSIEDLLLLGRIEAGQVEARRELVRLDRLVSDFEATIPELVVETSSAVTILADPALVRHALSNIFVNAQRHAAQPDRSLLIEAEVSGFEGKAVVTIADNGPGLTELRDIFKRHNTTSSSGGLGLWIVQTVLEEQSGTIAASNNSQGGATFELTWPIAHES